MRSLTVVLSFLFLVALLAGIFRTASAYVQPDADDLEEDDEKLMNDGKESSLEHFPEDADLKGSLERFQTWFLKQYKGDPRVELAPAGDGMRMGVFAKEDIRAESLYLSLPIDMIIGDRTIFKSSVIGPALQKLQHTLNTGGNTVNKHQATLGIFILYERFVTGKRSFWRPYLDLIPTSHDAPEFFTEKELDLLQGTYIKEKAIANRNAHNNEFQWLKTHVFDKDPATFPAHTFTYEHWLWVAGTLQSRMIWWDNAPHLVPMLDMINCKEGTSNPRRVHRTSRSSKTDTADTYAPWTFKKGDQIYENYGQPNPTYFLYHGFVLEPNVHDCATVQIPRHKVTKKTTDALERWRQSKLEHCVSPTAYNAILSIARVEVSSKKQVDAMKQMPTAPFTKDSKREKAALRWAGELLKEQLDTYPMFDSWRKNAERSPFRERMAVTFRETQRMVLEETIEVYRRAFKKLKLASQAARAAQFKKQEEGKKKKEQEASGKSGDL